MELIFLLSKINILENCAKYYTGLYLLLSFKAMWFQTVEGLLLATTLALLPWKDFQGNRNCFSPNSPMVSMAHDMNSIICCKAILYKWCLSAYIFNGHLEPPILWGTHFPFTGGSFFIMIKQRHSHQHRWDKRIRWVSITSGDDRSLSISGTNFRLATGDFLSLLNGTLDIMFPTTAISSLLFSSVTGKQVKTHDFKIWTDIKKGKLCSSLESSKSVSTSILI